MTPAQLIEYVNRGGTGCPVCGPAAETIGYSIHIINQREISQERACEDDHVWGDLYKLTEAEELTE